MRAATLLPCLLLAGCIPPKSSKDYSVPFARSYWATPAAQRPTLSSLTMEQLYSLNQYGRRAFHPWRTMAPAFGCRGAAAVPYLKTKIAPKTVGGLLETLAWMRRMETYEPARDAELMAIVRAAYARQPKMLRKAYAPYLAEVEGKTSESPFYGAGSAERLRTQYCTPAATGLDSGAAVN